MAVPNLLGKTKTSTSTDFVGILNLEDEAEWVEGVMAEVRYKFVEMLPALQRIHAHFTSHKRGSINFRGCKSWTEYCKQRLHVTPDAIFMTEKRLRLKAAAAEKAKAAAAEKRQNQRWLRELDAQNLAEESHSPASMEFARARNLQWCDQKPGSQSGYESTVDDQVDDDDDWVVPLETLKEVLSATDETVTMLKKIMNSGLIAGDPALLESTKACAANAANVAADVRKDYGLTGGKVISIASAQRGQQ